VKPPGLVKLFDEPVPGPQRFAQGAAVNENRRILGLRRYSKITNLLDSNMKILLAFLIVVASGIWWWQNPDLVKSYAAKATHRTGMFLLNLFDAPANASNDGEELSSVVAVSDTSPYFIRDRITLNQNGSTRVVEKGTEVRKIGDGGGKYLVQDALGRFFVEPHALTRDAQEATYLRKKVAAESDRNSRALAVGSLQLQLEELDQKLILARRELADTEAREKAEYEGRIQRNPMKTTSAFLRNVVVRMEATRSQLRQQLNKLGITAPPSPSPSPIANPAASQSPR
jgi:hypothetical protein